MVSLKNCLFQLITEQNKTCGLCLRATAEKYCSIFDLVSFDYSNNNKEIITTELLIYILGPEYFQNLTTEILCCDCLTKTVSCYKFMKMCRENAKYVTNMIEVIEKLSDDTSYDKDRFKTLYLTIDDHSFTGTKYFDQTSVNKNCNEALRRLEIVSNSRQTDTPELDDETEAFADSEFGSTDKKTKQYKQAEDLIDKITITDVLFDENNLSLLKCKICKRMFPRMHNLKRHFIRVHAPKNFACTKCNKSFGSPAILEEHKLESHSGRKIVCIECGKMYASTQSLKLHELSHKLALKCGACGKTFNRKRNYHIHVTSKRCDRSQRRIDVEKKYVCDYCNKKYACKGTLRVHIQFEHGNGSQHICSWCGKKFCSKGKLNAHVVTHTQEKNFSCEICGGSFVSKQSLLYHTRTHTGEKPYQCEHCDQRFLSTSRRAEHVRHHHMDPSLECDVCHTKFRGRSSLLRHKKRHFDPNSRLHYTKLAENEV